MTLLYKLFKMRLLLCMYRYFQGNMTKYFQGDIRLDNDIELELKNGTTGDPSRNAIRTRKRLWTDRVIPFYIPSSMSEYLFLMINKIIK